MYLYLMEGWNTMTHRFLGSVARQWRLHGSRRVLIVMICLLCAAAGCRQKPAQEARDANAAVASPADLVVVQINDVNITQGDLDTLVAQEMNAISPRISHMSEAYYKQREKEARKEVVEVLVAEYLLDEQVKQLGIQVSDQEIDDHIALMASQQKPPMSVEEYVTVLKESGRPLKAVREELRRDLAWYQLYERQWAGKPDIPETEITEYYNKHQADYRVPERVRASHIVIDPQKVAPGADAAQAKIQARQRAEEILKQIREGADFQEMARVYSHEASSAANGGDVGYFQRGDMEPSFEKAAFALAPGQVSDIVETRQGLHIIKVTEHQGASVMSPEEARADITERLTLAKKTQIIKAYIQSLKEQAQVKYHTMNP